MTSMTTLSGVPRRTTSPLLISRMLSSVCLPATVSGGMLNGVFGLTVSSIGVGNVGPRSVALTTASGANGGRFPGVCGATKIVLTIVAMSFGTVCCAGSTLRPRPKRMMSSFARKRSFCCADTCVVPMLATPSIRAIHTIRTRSVLTLVLMASDSRLRFAEAGRSVCRISRRSHCSHVRRSRRLQGT